MLRKLQTNNKGGADLQFATATFVLMFVICMGLLMDFWYVSSAKVAVLKSVESTELYCLVHNAPDDYSDAKLSFEEMWKRNLEAEQREAVACAKYGGYGGASGGELVARMGNLPYLKEVEVIKIEGLPQPIGEMGIRSQLRYKVNTMIRTPEQIFNFMRSDDLDVSATKWVPLTVTAKLVPMVSDVHIGK